MKVFLSHSTKDKQFVQTLAAELDLTFCFGTLEEAHALMSAEPLIKRRLREFDLRPWELREGRIFVICWASNLRCGSETSPTRGSCSRERLANSYVPTLGAG
jgi:hypothetical protein